MIGTYADAMLARDEYMSLDNEHLFSSDGTTRQVYLINDVIYKVEAGCGSNSPYYYSDNRDEYENMTTKSLPEGLHFPDVALYEVGTDPIIAMEYICGQPMSECFCENYGDEHTPECAPAWIVELALQVIDDTGGLNIIQEYKTGLVYIIDAAC